jgi:hypothetical protein
MHHSDGVATMGDVQRIRENGREEGTMELKWMAVGALALVPCAAFAQGKTAKDTSATRRDSSSQQTTSPTRRDSSQKTTTSTSTGDVSGGGSNVTQAMLTAQGNANMIGTPAWWKTHGTADGKPPIAPRTSNH